jgi:hypothetical protein
MSNHVEPASNDNMTSTSVIGYKVFEDNWVCRGYQFPFGDSSDAGNDAQTTIAVHDGPVEMCLSGFHFCQRALDCILYYVLDPGYKYARVAASGIVETDGDKSVTNQLTLVEELSYEQFKSLIDNERKNSTITYKDGQKHGLHTKWWENGHKAFESNYQEGLQHGICTEWYPNGNVWIVAHFEEGRQHGLYTYFYHNGQMAIETTYDEGHEDGERRHWLKDGQQVYTRVYCKGRCVASVL